MYYFFIAAGYDIIKLLFYSRTVIIYCKIYAKMYTVAQYIAITLQ